MQHNSRWIGFLLSAAIAFGITAHGCQSQTRSARPVHGDISQKCTNPEGEHEGDLSVTIVAAPSVFEYDNKIDILVERPDDPHAGSFPNRLVVNYHYPGGGMRGCGGVHTVAATFSITENAAESVIVQIFTREPIRFAIVRETGEPFYGPMIFAPDTKGRLEWPREVHEGKESPASRVE